MLTSRVREKSKFKTSITGFDQKIYYYVVNDRYGNEYTFDNTWDAKDFANEENEKIRRQERSEEERDQRLETVEKSLSQKIEFYEERFAEYEELLGPARKKMLAAKREKEAEEQRIKDEIAEQKHQEHLEIKIKADFELQKFFIEKYLEWEKSNRKNGFDKEVYTKRATVDGIVDHDHVYHLFAFENFEEIILAEKECSWEKNGVYIPEDFDKRSIDDEKSKIWDGTLSATCSEIEAFCIWYYQTRTIFFLKRSSWRSIWSVIKIILMPLFWPIFEGTEHPIINTLHTFFWLCYLAFMLLSLYVVFVLEFSISIILVLLGGFVIIGIVHCIMLGIIAKILEWADIY